jgi:hypothetical protein
MEAKTDLKQRLVIHPQPQLNISEQGNLHIEGDIDAIDLQAILDTSIIKQRLYLEHQRRLQSESDRCAVIIGCIFAGFIGLSVFCLFNQKPTGVTSNGIFIGIISRDV